MIFSEGSRYNKYECNTINKQINGPSYCCQNKQKEKRRIVTALPLPSGEKKSQCFARIQRQRSLLLELRSKIL